MLLHLQRLILRLDLKKAFMSNPSKRARSQSNERDSDFLNKEQSILNELKLQEKQVVITKQQQELDFLQQKLKILLARTDSQNEKLSDKEKEILSLKEQVSLIWGSSVART